MDNNINNIVILTGAGISADSGVKTFRDNGGLWEDHDIMDVATPEGFTRDPELVYRFYNARRAQLPTVSPNAAHNALADLQKRFAAAGGSVTIVTQNVDDLHERGGSEDVWHMHGELNAARCTACGWQGEWRADMFITTDCPACAQPGSLRPHIVWFGEMPFYMRKIDAAIQACDLFVSIGTSGAVYPAAGFVHTARQLGKATLELNLEPSEGSGQFDEARYGRAKDIVPVWAESIVPRT